MRAGKRIGQGVVLGCLVAVLALGAIKVCPKCGYENDPRVERCVHCSVDLPGSGAVPVPPSEPESAADASVYVDVDTVEEAIRRGMDCADEGRVELGYCFFKNAAVLDLLAAPSAEGGAAGGASGRSRPERILAMVARCEAQFAKAVRRTCPACGGSRKGVVELSSLGDGDEPLRPAKKRLCLKCEGRGYVLGRRTIDERTYSLGKARQRYVQIQQGRRYVPIGRAWLPGAAAERLAVRDVALVKRSLPIPCEACAGMGREDCRACRGTGEVPCPNRGCIGGMVEKEAGGRLTRTGMKQAVKCRICGGTGRVACSDCSGNGSVLCEDCHGTGTGASCRKCGGQGVAACRRCDGSGRRDGLPCASCGGQGAALCASCRGEGRKR